MSAYAVTAFLDDEDPRPGHWFCIVDRKGHGRLASHGGFASRSDALAWGRKQALKDKSRKPKKHETVTEYV